MASRDSEAVDDDVGCCAAGRETKLARSVGAYFASNRTLAVVTAVVVVVLQCEESGYWRRLEFVAAVAGSDVAVGDAVLVVGEMSE